MSAKRLMMTLAVALVASTWACDDGSGPVAGGSELSGLEQGEALFQQFCSGCHGANAEGTAAGVSLITPHINEQSDSKLFILIQSGTGGAMPSFGDVMTNDEIINVIAYLRDIQDPQSHGTPEAP